MKVKERKVIRIHNPLMALPSFAFKGIEAYSTRAMTDVGGITVVADCGNPALLQEAHQYLRTLGLGSEELILVQTPANGDLYQAILNNFALRRRIVDLVRDQDYKVEFFCTRGKIESTFLLKLGLNWSHTVSHPGGLADFWNNKSLLRRIAAMNGLGYLFPEHRLVNTVSELRRAVVELLSKNPEVVIKRPLWASGAGMVFGNSEKVVDLYLTEHGGVPEGTIVERSLGSEHQAMSVVTRFEKGSVTDQWFTEQECPQREHAVVHEGSILGDLPDVNSEDKKWMKEATRPLYELVRLNYPRLTGIVNFDCLRLGEERFVLECNARVTFSTYVQEIRRSLLSGRDIVFSNEEAEATCLVRKVVPETAKDFVSLQRVLGHSLLLDPKQSGAIPIVLGCLPTSGYCYLVSVADSYKAAKEIMSEAREKLES